MDRDKILHWKVANFYRVFDIVNQNLKVKDLIVAYAWNGYVVFARTLESSVEQSITESFWNMRGK
jgi:hypothetical protein